MTTKEKILKDVAEALVSTLGNTMTAENADKVVANQALLIMKEILGKNTQIVRKTTMFVDGSFGGEKITEYELKELKNKII